MSKTLPQARPETLPLGQVRHPVLGAGQRSCPQARSDNLPLGQAHNLSWSEILPLGQVQIPHTPCSECTCKIPYPKHRLKGTSKTLLSGQVRDPTTLLFSIDIHTHTHTTKIYNLFMCSLNINIALLNNNLRWFNFNFHAWQVHCLQ